MMSKYHAELMSGTIGEAARELKEAALDEFDNWAAIEPNEAAGVAGGPYDTSRRAAEVALSDVRSLLDDYLGHTFALVLASWGLTAGDGEIVWRCAEEDWRAGNRKLCNAASAHRDKCGWVRVVPVEEVQP